MMTLESPVLIAEVQAGVLTLTLSRPAVLNSLTAELLDALAEALAMASDDSDVRAIVLTGAGRGFCSGQDLSGEGSAIDIEVRTQIHDHYVPVITALRDVEKPVIAAINGVAAGAGLSLALAADLRVAAESATFVQAFVRIGLVPDAGATYFLPRIVGLTKAAELAFFGDTIDANEAFRIGLVNRVVPDGDLAASAQELAGRLAKGPRSLGLIKRALNHSLTNHLDAQLALEEELQVAATTTSDFVEGLTAFRGKRPPTFTGK